MITDIHWRRKINGTVSAQFLGFYGPETWGFIMKICYIFDWNDIFSTLKKRKYTFFQHSSLKILPIPLLTFVLDNPHESFCCKTKKNTRIIWIFDDIALIWIFIPDSLDKILWPFKVLSHPCTWNECCTNISGFPEGYGTYMYSVYPTSLFSINCHL